MKTRQVHTLILGAGPAGLSAAHLLAKAGLQPVILERDRVPGGLMRSITRDDFVVDVGRKELYNRLDKVDRFWSELLGGDYRPYPHRGGFLYRGRILEMSREHRGIRRGMPWSMLLRCVGSLVVNRLNPFAQPPATVEQYFYRTRGRSLTEIAAQAFQEKLTGHKWSDLELPPAPADGYEERFLSTITAALSRALSKSDVNTADGRWRHPAKGTGQICDRLASEIERYQGEFAFGATLKTIHAGTNCVDSVVAELAGEPICFQPRHVISSIPLPAMTAMLGINAAKERPAAQPARKRTVVLVYLFLDCEPRFPHAWLQVTCPTTRIGRITNYAAFNGDMVPPGKGCVCCEYYAFGSDPLLEKSDAALIDETAQFCQTSELIDRAAISDALVLRLPGADASQNRHNWITAMRLGLLNDLGAFRNLYYVGRTDLDIATLAGLEAAEAVMAGRRELFDRHFDPDELGIKSTPKAFEFKIPPWVTLRV